MAENCGTECVGDDAVSDYTVKMPVLGANKEVKSRVKICASQNYPHWADPGAPSLVCDESL